MKNPSWRVINKLDLCLAIILGEKIMCKDTDVLTDLMYYRIAAQKWWELDIPGKAIEEYNDSVKCLLSGDLNVGTFDAIIPSVRPEDDVEALWRWRFANRTGK